MDEDDSHSVSIDSSFEGLCLTSVTQFRVESNGRRKNVPQNGIVRTLRLCLPLMMTPSVWQRHELSIDDIVDVLDCFKAHQLWQLAQLLGIPVSSSSIKLGFSHATSIVCSSKSIIMEKITKTIRDRLDFSFNSRSVLDKSHEDHVPPLPVHFIPIATYTYWKERVVKNLTHIGENVVDEFFTWKDIQMYPIGLEIDHLYMIRCVSKSVFDASGRVADSLVTSPIQFRIGDAFFCGLIDETAFFLPN